MTDTTVTIEDESGETDEITLPAELVELLSEEESETTAEVVGDVALMGFTSRAHMIAHHGEGEADEAVEDAEERALELFEERFGVSYAEATGHSH